MFYDFKIQEMIQETSGINEIGLGNVTYSEGRKIECDIQPAIKTIVKKTFGENVESSFIMFCDELLELGQFVKYQERIYKINYMYDWIDYKVYSLIESALNG